MATLRTLGHKLKPSSSYKVRIPAKKAAPFYLSTEWRSLMDQIIAERFGHRLRAKCEDPQCRYPDRVGTRIFGDHIKELKDGGAPLDKRNVMCRCGSCHSRVTAERRAKRYSETGIGHSETGMGVGSSVVPKPGWG